MTYEEIKVIMDDLEENGEYEYYAIRFDDKDYQIGDVLPESKELPEDIGVEFPEFGSDEYEDLDYMGATSVYTLESQKSFGDFKAGTSLFKHLNIVGANEGGDEDDHDLDYGESLFVDPVVVAKIY